MEKEKDLSLSENLETEQKKRIANCDQEIWVMERIRTVIRMANDLKYSRRVGADDPLYLSSIDGLVNGAAFEIIRTLGMEPEYTNIKNPYHNINR